MISQTLFEKESEVAYIFYDSETREYFSNFYSTSGVVLLLREKNFLFVDNRYFEKAKQEARSDFEVVLIEKNQSHTKVRDILLEYRISKIVFDAKKTTYAEYLELKKWFDGFCLVDDNQNVDILKSQKSEIEIEKITKAQEITEKGFLHILSILKEGVSELDLVAELEYKFRKLGASGTAFDSIIAFSEGSSMPHYASKDRKLKKDDTILMDIGAKYKGYCSDMTRTFVFGKPTAEFRQYFEITKNCLELLENSIKVGDEAGNIDKLAREYFDRFKVADRFIHASGHGVGTYIHEYPSVSPNSKDIFLENAITTLEPGLYFTGKFGIRIEDMILLKKDRAEVITKLDKQIIL